MQEVLSYFGWITEMIYNQVPLQCCLISHDITYDTVITVAEIGSDIRITTDSLYLALTGDLWGAYCEDFRENWPRYNGTALYMLTWHASYQGIFHTPGNFTYISRTSEESMMLTLTI